MLRYDTDTKDGKQQPSLDELEVFLPSDEDLQTAQVRCAASVSLDNTKMKKAPLATSLEHETTPCTGNSPYYRREPLPHETAPITGEST